MNENPELNHGIGLIADKFPNEWAQASDTIILSVSGDQIREIRLAVVIGNQCYAGTANTAEAAFEKLVAEYHKPKTAAIQKARELLEKEGFTVSPVS
jgi:hypothetical protein